MAVQQGRSERRGEAYSPLHVELLSDARTTLADFFNSLLVMCQDIDRQGVRLAVKILEQGIFEYLVLGGSGHEQGQAGSEFQMVRIAEYLFSAAPAHVENKLRAGSEPKNRVLQVGLGLIERGNGECLCRSIRLRRKPQL
jgi:hypothetical protein